MPRRRSYVLSVKAEKNQEVYQLSFGKPWKQQGRIREGNRIQAKSRLEVQQTVALFIQNIRSVHQNKVLVQMVFEQVFTQKSPNLLNL